MRYFRLAFLILLFLQLGPISVQAETNLSAGFAPNSVWLSKNNIITGDSVNIFTVIYNSSEEGVSGNLIFLVDEKSVGVKHFTLASGETQAQSLPWIASSGQHTISARIDNTLNTKTNTSQSLNNKTTSSITVNIKPAPPPPPPVPPSQTTQVLNTVVSGVQTGIALSAPVISNVIKSIYKTTESLRTSAESALAKQIEKKAGTKITPTNKPVSANTDSTEAEDGIVPRAQKYLAGAIFAIVSSKTLFYLALLLSIIFIFLMLRMVLKDRKRI